MQSIKIQKHSPGFNDVSWVLKARSKDESRPALLHVEVKKDSLCCTDGHRLHLLWENSLDIPPGIYEVMKSTKSEIILLRNEDGPTFPDWSVFLSGEPFNVRIEHGIGEFGYTEVIRGLPDARPIDFRYWNDAIDTGRWECYTRDDEKMLRFRDTQGLRTALIMPMRV